jgi:hypothetical protein
MTMSHSGGRASAQIYPRGCACVGGNHLTDSDIAARFGVTVDAIVLLNHLDNPNRIEAGQILLIPLP